MVNHALHRARQGQEERKPKVEKQGRVYLVTSGQRTVTIDEDRLRMLKDLYCGSPQLTINQVCRKMDLPRRDFVLIKTAFSITKDDAPFIDDDILQLDAEELANISLEKAKDQYFIKLEQKQFDFMQKELAKYRQKDYFVIKLHEMVSEHMQEFAKSYKLPRKNKVEPDAGDYMLEVPIVDLHLGKLAWAPEVGLSYDYKIARKRFLDVVQNIYERALRRRGIEKILFIIGSDYFNVDNIENTTTAGTHQDADLRWHKLFAVGVSMLVEAIDLFATISPVEVVSVPGNHDHKTVFYASMYLQAYYKDSEQVAVSDDLKTRKHIEYGKTLIGFSHGHQEGKRIYGTLSVEAPTAWSRTKYREIHVGHFHHEKTVEQNGIIVRNLSSITGDDAWHFEKGYTGATKKVQSFLWHKQDGLQEIWHTNI